MESTKQLTNLQLELIKLFDFQTSKKQLLEIKRLIKKQEELAAKLEEEIDYTDEKAVQKYLSEIASLYPEGVTEEITESSNKNITRTFLLKHLELFDVFQLHRMRLFYQLF